MRVLNQALQLVEDELLGLLRGHGLFLLKVDIHLRDELIVGNVAAAIGVDQLHQVVNLLECELQAKCEPALAELFLGD